MSLSEQYELYSRIRISTLLYNEAFGRVLIPCLKVTLGIFTVASAYSAIRLFGAGEYFFTLYLFLFVVLGLGIQLFLYPMAAKIREMSLTFSRIPPKPHTKYEAALRRAFIPMGITSGPYYIINSHTTLTYFSAIITTTIGFLMV